MHTKLVRLLLALSFPRVFYRWKKVVDWINFPLECFFFGINFKITQSNTKCISHNTIRCSDTDFWAEQSIRKHNSLPASELFSAGRLRSGAQMRWSAVLWLFLVLYDLPLSVYPAGGHTVRDDNLKLFPFRRGAPLQTPFTGHYCSACAHRRSPC